MVLFGISLVALAIYYWTMSITLGPNNVMLTVSGANFGFQEMTTKMDLSVKQKFETYPQEISTRLRRVRELIFNVAKKDGIAGITETLKWGEPSYVSEIGSTIRIDWKAKYPDQYCIYFNCKTSLIETFKEVYGDTFTYEGNRAIIIKVDQSLPLTELSHCISMSLRYKKIKHLDLLGA